MYDKDFIRRFQNRDPVLFQSLYDNHCKTLVSKICRAGFTSNAEDLVHDAWMSLWNDPTRFDFSRGSTIEAYVYRTAFFMGRDHYRKRHELPLQDEAHDIEHAARTDGLLGVDAKDDSEAAPPLVESLREALQRLTSAERELLEAKISMDRASEYERIAQRENISRGAVRDRVLRAVKKLRLQLQPHSPPEH